MRILSLLSSGGLHQRMQAMMNKTLLASGLVAALVTLPAFADEASDVSKLMRAGQLSEALSKADAVLVQRPKDAQMRFLKGVILTEQNKSAEAISIFAKLTDDFPDLPEPYNNLAVLYASSGQYDKARAALDMAIRTNPSYATAYENLGDIHAKLASQAYDKALQLDSGNSGAKSKLTLLRTLAANNGGNVKPAANARVPAPAALEPQSAAVKPAPIAPVAKADPKPATKPEPEERQAAAADGERADVLKVIHAWAAAWSDQDIKAYLNYYSNDFQAPRGQSRAAWAEERRARIVGKDRISIRIESPQVSVKGDTATAKFRQIYASDRLKADTRKVLVLTRQGSKWRIQQERVGN